MASTATDELTIRERGILATGASATYLDCFSNADRVLVSVPPQPALVPRRREYDSRGKTYAIHWQDNGQPLPVWFDPLMQGFVDLLTLPPNWDSYGASGVDTKVVHAAISFINGFLRPSSPAPRVVPLSSGGLQLEWRRNGVDLEIVFDRDERPFFYWRDRVSGEESEHALPESCALLRTCIEKLE